jgi:hypothetical protein
LVFRTVRFYFGIIKAGPALTYDWPETIPAGMIAADRLPFAGH